MATFANQVMHFTKSSQLHQGVSQCKSNEGERLRNNSTEKKMVILNGLMRKSRSSSFLMFSFSVLKCSQISTELFRCDTQCNEAIGLK